MVKDEKGNVQLFAEGLSQKRHSARENLERLINELRYVKQINMYKSQSWEQSKFIKPTIPHPYSDAFSDFPEILMSRNRDLRLPTMPFVAVALFRQPYCKQLYATKLWKLHTQKECTLKPRASVTRISAGTLSPNFTNITSPTTSFSAVMLCFSPSLRTVASCEWNILFPWNIHLRKGLLHHVLKGSQS